MELDFHFFAGFTQSCLSILLTVIKSESHFFQTAVHLLNSFLILCEDISSLTVFLSILLIHLFGTISKLSFELEVLFFDFVELILKLADLFL